MPAADTDDLALLNRVAPKAGEIAMHYFGFDPKYWHKDGDQGPVSEADLEIDQFLKTELQRARPDYGWLSEETDEDLSRMEKKRIFIVDPIDGTRSFLAREENFAIAMAVVEDGEVIASVVDMPAKRQRYTAAKGQGAAKNGKPISPSKKSKLKSARILAAGPQLQTKLWPKGIPPVERHFRSSIAYRLCLVAEGRFDGMLTMRPTWEWDCSAGHLICEEAGVLVRDMNGQPHRYNSEGAQMNGVIAAPPKLHKAFMAYR